MSDVMLGIMHMVAHDRLISLAYVNVAIRFQTLSDSSIESNPKSNINTPRAKIGQLPG